MNTIFVTIIIPIYNVKKYLGECLTSIERQTIKDNIEVLLINDGSNDGSKEIAKDFEDRNENFILINRTNGGLSAARNTGLIHATGEYIIFLDSDDFLADDAIELLYLRAKNDDLDLLRFSAYTFEDGFDNYIWERNSAGKGYKYLGKYPDVMTGSDFLELSIKYNDCFPSCCLMLIRKKVIDVNSLKFYEGIILEDNLFNFELTTLCRRVGVLNEPLYYRRYRKGSITMSDNWLSRIEALCICSEEVDRFYLSHLNIEKSIVKWQINLFIYKMIDDWNELSCVEQRSDRLREYFRRVKPLISKYKISGFSLRLFYFSPSFYWSCRLVASYAFKKR